MIITSTSLTITWLNDMAFSLLEESLLASKSRSESKPSYTGLSNLHKVPFRVPVKVTIKVTVRFNIVVVIISKSLGYTMF